MVALKLYDSLTRSVQVFSPLASRTSASKIGIYSCGPTVYARQHLGNMRPYVFADLLRRTLVSAGYAVRHVVNITDVGHLTSDADEGADKVELAAARAHTSAFTITEHFTALFQADLRRLHVLPPDVVCDLFAGHGIEPDRGLIQPLKHLGIRLVDNADGRIHPMLSA